MVRTLPKGVRLLFAPAAACALAALPVAAAAEDFSLISQKWQVALGTFINASELDIRVDGEVGEGGTTINWGTEFGDNDVTRVRLDGVWRFANRHHLRILYTDYSRGTTREASRDIEWDGDLIPVGVEVRARAGFEVIELAYEYAFKKSEDFELLGSAGLHYTAFEASLRAEVTVPGGGATESRGGRASVDAPLPVFGLRAMWRMGGDWYLDAQGQYFALAIDNIDGRLVNYRGAVIWQPRKSLGLGIGYDSFTVDVDTKKDRFRGSMDWTYSGPQIFLSFGF